MMSLLYSVLKSYCHNTNMPLSLFWQLLHPSALSPRAVQLVLPWDCYIKAMNTLHLLKKKSQINLILTFPLLLWYHCGKTFPLPSHILSLAAFEVSQEAKSFCIKYPPSCSLTHPSPEQLNVYVVKIIIFVSIQNFNHNFFDMWK